MKKKLVNCFFFILILSFVFQPSFALATSNTGVIEPESQPLSDLGGQLGHELPVAPKFIEIPELMLSPESLLPEYHDVSEKPYAELRSDPNLPEDIRIHLVDMTELVEKPEYVSPTPEVIALTQQQVQNFDCSTVTDVPQQECEILVTLFNSTNGAGWCKISNWLTGTLVDSWGGVTVTNGHVTELNLYNNCLSGVLPPQLGDLVFLERAFMFNGGLSGNIPREITQLNNLTHLSLGDNLYSGPLPAFLGEFPSLVSLGLNDNDFTGSIPPELGNLSNLEYITLSENRLSGSIPVELSSLSKLQGLFLDRNDFTGTIPSQLGSLTSLQQLYLFGNGLSGEIPLSFINLSSLSQFHFENTFLCEPTTPEFLTWKATVQSWKSTGIICETNDPAGDWLIMYYLVGDNDGHLNIAALHNYLAGTTNANIDLAIYWDRKYFETEYLYKFDSGDESKENFENLDSDNPQTLIDFVNWAQSKTNKTYTTLVLVDHGNALAGFGWDEGSDSFDYLSHKELGDVFDNIGPIDVLFIEACTMANLEPVWEFREHVKYYVGHEGITHLFPYSHSFINNIPASFSASQIAYNIADSHFRFYDSINFASTVSVLDLQKLDELVANLSQLSYSMLTASDNVKDAVWTTMISPDLYRVPISQKKQVVDLLQFVNSIMNIPELNTYANSVVESILDLVRYNGQVSTIFENNENANGVSVALPVEKTSFYSGELFNFASSADWSQTNNTLSQDLTSYDPTINYWGLFVSTYILENNPESEDSPEPPPLLPLETLGILYLPIIITTD